MQFFTFFKVQTLQRSRLLFKTSTIEWGYLINLSCVNCDALRQVMACQVNSMLRKKTSGLSDYPFVQKFVNERKVRWFNWFNFYCFNCDAFRQVKTRESCILQKSIVKLLKWSAIMKEKSRELWKCSMGGNFTNLADSERSNCCKET